MPRSSTTWQKGQSGNPRGAVPHTQSPTALLRLALAREYAPGVTALEHLMVKAVMAILRQVESGDLTNLQWLVSRLDGAAAAAPEASMDKLGAVLIPRLMRRGKSMDEVADAIVLLKAAASTPVAPLEGAPGAAPVARSVGVLKAVVGLAQADEVPEDAPAHTTGRTNGASAAAGMKGTR